jgi:peptidoglycan-N-acetylglucosamine deacetylase
VWRRSLLGAVVALAAALPAGAASEFNVPYGKQVYCGGGRARFVALTFDDGPGPYTPRLVGALRRHHAQATFFVIGNRLRYWSSYARAEAKVGELGNHSWDHPHLATLRPAAVMRELRSTQEQIARSTGQWPPFFRPPYEEATRAVERAARVLGLIDVRWSADSGDSLPGATPARTIARADAALRPGAIILLHDSHPWTADVAASILRTARARHLRAVTLSRMLTLDPPRSGCIR